MRIPIIIVHKGDSFYLEPVLRQIRRYNPDNSVYLISDESTNHYDFVSHVNIAGYYSLAEEFVKCYQHMSSNPYEYELFCFLRWFIILDFVKKNQLSHFLCLDSDVLLYCNVDDVFQKWLDSDMTICQPNGPQYTLFNTKSLQQFCDYILSHYVTEEGKEQLKEWNRKIVFGGICDMTFIKYYAQLPAVRVVDTSKIYNDTCFDVNMQVSQGFEMQGRVKKIYWKDGLPYGKLQSSSELVRFNALHFQGGVKHVMNKYLDEYNGKRALGNMKWYFNPKRLKCRYSEVRKMLGNTDMLAHILKKKIGLA